MKQLLILIVGILLSLTAHAKCMSHNLWVFPEGETIKQNSIFILEGFAKSQTIIRGLNNKYKVYLKTGNITINLVVTDTFAGQFGLTQALLQPETELVAGREYTLHIDGLPVEEKLQKYDKAARKYKPITYKVSAGRDTEKPHLKSTPEKVRKTFVRYGCGPAAYVIFSNPATDDSEVIVRTTVKNLYTGEKTTYCIPVSGEEIKVGHGMCSGAFYFMGLIVYEVEFAFMDACGNITQSVTAGIKFTAPTEESAEE